MQEPATINATFRSRLSGHQKRLSMLREWARHDAETYEAFVACLSRHGFPVRECRILDIGCGPNAPMTVMLHSAGATVTGVDEQLGFRWGLGFRPSRFRQYYRMTSLATTARKVAGEVIYDRRYYSWLSKFLGFALTERGLDLRAAHAENTGLASGSYDVIHSNATWEHVADPLATNEEVARLLRPGGLAYIEIHLFPSLSGGHDLPWIVPGSLELGSVTPWGHLRDPQWKPPVKLNRLREPDYRQLFEAVDSLEILEWATEFIEGSEHLTPTILAELPDYSVEELTKRSIIVVLRKRTST